MFWSLWKCVSQAKGSGIYFYVNYVTIYQGIPVVNTATKLWNAHHAGAALPCATPHLVHKHIVSLSFFTFASENLFAIV
jgi:hypothetical protein